MKKIFSFRASLILLAFLAFSGFGRSQTFNYGTGSIASNSAPFNALGGSGITVSGNDITVTSNVNMPSGVYNFANFTINAGVTVTVTGNSGPLIIRCTGDFVNNGELRAVSGNGGNASGTTGGAAGVAVAGGVNGGVGGAGGSNGTSTTGPGLNFFSTTARGIQGCGLSPTRPSWAGPGGGGGGHATAGGNGTSGSGQSTGCATGGVGGTATYGNAALTVNVGAPAQYQSLGATPAGDRWLLGGCSGAGGHGTQSFLGSARAAGGGGGASGGAIQIVASNVTIGSGAWIRCRGGNGGSGSLSSSGAAAGGGGGGGAGGTINIQYLTSYTNNGNAPQVSGGIQGFGQFGTTGTGGDGGSGGSGRVLIEQDVILCTQPTTASINFGSSNISQSSADLSWVRGDGDAIIVVVREGSPVSGGPVSGTIYSANANFGSGDALGGGFVVYQGTGTNVSVTNLPNVNTTYHVSVFEYNNLADPCYQSSSLSGSFVTEDGAMVYISSTNVQQTGSSPLGSTNQEILRLEVSVGPGTLTPLTLSSITFNTTGTTDPTDLTGARIYYTGLTNTFSSTTPFGTQVSNPSGTHVVNGTQVLQAGVNYFWLVYDVSISGTPGNLLDAQITSINVGSSETPIETNPIGNRTITSLMNLSCGYTFSNFTPTWSSNVGQSGTTVVASGAASIDDQRWPNQNFATDFTFEYNGTVYNSFGIHSKGYIWFGSTTPSGLASTPISSTLAYDGAIAPFAFDMVAHSASTTTPQVTVRYIGTAPNRVCIIEWTAFRPFGNTGGLCSLFGSPTDWNRYDFQLHLYENGGSNANRIEFVYRDMNSFCVNGNGANAQVGLRGPSNADFLNRTGSGNNAHTSSAAGTLNTQVIAHGANNFFNGNGGMRFSPTFQLPSVSPSPTATNICPDITVNLSTTSPVAIKQWYNNSLPIAGAINSNYIADASGTHIIVVSQGGCSKVSEPIAVTIENCNVCSTVFGIDKIESCGPITWIDGNTYSTNNNTATFLLPNASSLGCDSLVTLDLTIFDCIQLNPTSCGATNVSMNQLVNSIVAPAALQYKFRITGPNNGGPGWNAQNQFEYISNSKNFRFQFIPGSQWGATYGVEVAYATVANEFSPYGSSCVVTLQSLMAVSLSVVNPVLCGNSVTMDDFIGTAWVPGAQAYRFQIVGDNAAVWPSNTYVVETAAPLRKFKFGQIPGALFGSTYAVSVGYHDGSGNWTAYGAPCNITIETPSTQLEVGDCGAVGVLNTDFLRADNVVGASGYRFRITGANSAGWVMDQTTVDRPNRVFWMNLANGWLPGETYTIEVAVQDAAGNYGAYGPSCSVTMSGTPSLVIDVTDESVNTKASIEGMFGATASHNPFTRDFGLSLVNANDTDAINVSIYDMSGKLIEASAVNPMDIESARFGANLATGMYMLQVTQGAKQAVIRQVKH